MVEEPSSSSTRRLRVLAISLHGPLAHPFRGDRHWMMAIAVLTAFTLDPNGVAHVGIRGQRLGL